MWVHNSVIVLIWDCMEGMEEGHGGWWARGVCPMMRSKGVLVVVELSQALCMYWASGSHQLQVV